MNTRSIFGFIVLSSLLYACNKESVRDPVSLAGSVYEGSITTGRGGENHIIIKFQDAQHFQFTQEFVDPESGQVYPLYDTGTWLADQTGLLITFRMQGRIEEAQLDADAHTLTGIWNESTFKASRNR